MKANITATGRRRVLAVRGDVNTNEANVSCGPVYPERGALVRRCPPKKWINGQLG